jgi:hypothetical protein
MMRGYLIHHLLLTEFRRLSQNSFLSEAKMSGRVQTGCMPNYLHSKLPGSRALLVKFAVPVTIVKVLVIGWCGHSELT